MSSTGPGKSLEQVAQNAIGHTDSSICVYEGSIPSVGARPLLQGGDSWRSLRLIEVLRVTSVIKWNKYTDSRS